MEHETFFEAKSIHPPFCLAHNGGSFSFGNAGHDGDCVRRSRRLRRYANVAYRPGGSSWVVQGALRPLRAAQRHKGGKRFVEARAGSGPETDEMFPGSSVAQTKPKPPVRFRVDGTGEPSKSPDGRPQGRTNLLKRASLWPPVFPTSIEVRSSTMARRESGRGNGKARPRPPSLVGEGKTSKLNGESNEVPTAMMKQGHHLRVPQCLHIECLIGAAR